MGVISVKCECSNDKLWLIVCVVVFARHNNTRLANDHLCPVMFGTGIEIREIFAAIGGQEGNNSLTRAMGRVEVVRVLAHC